jgi:hypothetical protein
VTTQHKLVNPGTTIAEILESVDPVHRAVARVYSAGVDVTDIEGFTTTPGEVLLVAVNPEGGGNKGGLLGGLLSIVVTAAAFYFAGPAGFGLTGTAFYRHIVVTAGTGAYTATATTDVSTPTPTPTATADPTLTGTIALSATTTAAVNGALSLSVPANAAASFGLPSLVNNKSTTTGTLPNVTVVDGRVVTRQGWTLSANVADFVNSSDNTVTIGKTFLGIAPSVVTGSTTATGVTAGTATVAGSATYPFTFAEGAAANTVGNSVIGGNLTFVAPQEKAAGTYTSTLTLTLVSK